MRRAEAGMGGGGSGSEDERGALSLQNEDPNTTGWLRKIHVSSDTNNLNTERLAAVKILFELTI